MLCIVKSVSCAIFTRWPMFLFWKAILLQKKIKIMSQFRLFRSTVCPETNVTQLSENAQKEVTMFYAALMSWEEVKNQVTAANADLGEVVESAHTTLEENFKDSWRTTAPFVFTTNAPLNIVIQLLEFTESRNKMNEEKMMFLIESFRRCNFPATLTDMQLLVEFSNLLDRDIGQMPLTLIYSGYNQCAMPVVGCCQQQQQKEKSFLESINPF